MDMGQCAVVLVYSSKWPRQDMAWHCFRRGFALIATISVMVLLVMVALAMLSLSSIELKATSHSRYQDEARANARLALMMALGKLQELAGPDQRVTARAAILEDFSDDSTLTNRNWLGIWKTTYESGGREWPLIGKAPDSGSGPYPYKGIYSDLRETEASLDEGKWRDILLQGWLVSRSSRSVSPLTALTEGDSRVVELLGRGTLGNGYGDVDFAKNRVLVEKVDIENREQKGAYAWYVSDNNQKTSIGLDPDASGDDQILFLATQTDNPSSLQSASGETPYEGYASAVKGHYGKLITDRSVAIVGGTSAKRDLLDQAIGADFHSLTTHGGGLFVDVTLGGLKKDLTPLLFGSPDDEIIHFVTPDPKVAVHDFSSDTPIVPGPRHAVLGPSFGALRYWGRMRFLTGLTENKINAQVEHGDSSSTRSRPVENWPGGVADGLTFDGGQWASKAPKVHPVMTDVRWHYYFSHSEGALGSLRTHIQPRVCLWNPYNVTLKTESMIVLMPNPYRGETAFHFTVEKEEAKRLNDLFPDGDLIPGHPDESWPFVNKNDVTEEATVVPSKAGLFPNRRYLGFLIEASEFQAGECLVFSPLVTSADISAGGIHVKKYNEIDISKNRLSAKSPQGGDHYYIDYGGELKLRTGKVEKADPDDPNSKDKDKKYWRVPHSDFFQALNLAQIVKYRPWPIFHDNLPFVLKAANSSSVGSAEYVSSPSLSDFPTLQLINNGNGGVATYDFWTQNFGDSTLFNSPFGTHLSSFQDEPDRQGSPVHQWGAKLLWLDESQNEGLAGDGGFGGAPLRGGMWSDSHSAYHPSPVAHWNIRPGMITRSPVSACTSSWIHKSCGAWMLQMNPFSPGDLMNAPSVNESGNYVKSPFARAGQMPDSQAVMFDLPDPEYGALSLGSLRHAQLSPYSWHPSYVVGHSLVDLYAPFDRSANMEMQGAYTGFKNSSWDEAISGYTIPWSEGKYGPRLSYSGDPQEADSMGLLQIGKEAISKIVEGQSVSSKDEVLAYDIAFEVNQNLWDSYFLSAIPQSSNGLVFSWDVGSGGKLWNGRYQLNHQAEISRVQVAEKLAGPEALSFAFWNSAYILKNRGAFNVNSTSVRAWTAFLSGLQGMTRMTQDGVSGGGSDSVFARVAVPQGAVKSDQVAADQTGGWLGGRILSESEMQRLAQEVVREVKARGPFVSMADFVNRRLAPKTNSSSRRGALEEAITRTELNAAYERSPFLTSSNTANDNNHMEWRIDVDKQPESKAWGIPGYLTQGDILEPLAPAMTVRGDSFTIRCYGEAQDDKGVIQAKAYLESVVMRSPEYVQGASGVYLATAPRLMIDRSSGELIEGQLSEVNKQFGRSYRIQSIRWLKSNEI